MTSKNEKSEDERGLELFERMVVAIEKQSKAICDKCEVEKQMLLEEMERRRNQETQLSGWE